ncbi:MAG: ASCH domain-containing protein [Spirochaetes bacterium]|nr:ASCH domain-containing protein [Spirochaetota bacterium]
MKAISIRQPWAELIIRGIKDVENRSWFTEHRGLLAIHAARTFYFNLDNKAEREEWEELRDEYGLDKDKLVYGALVGTVEVVEVTKQVKSKWHVQGSWGWYVTNAKRLEKPVPVRGMPGLFEVEI